MKKDKKDLINSGFKAPIRTEIEILGPDDVKSMKLGWIMEEKIGIGIVAPKLTWHRRLWLKVKSWFIKPKATYYEDN